MLCILKAPHQSTVYGIADSRVKITAELNGEIVASALSDRDGEFVLYLPPQEAGGPHTVRFSSPSPPKKEIYRYYTRK